MHENRHFGQIGEAKERWLKSWISISGSELSKMAYSPAPMPQQKILIHNPETATPPLIDTIGRFSLFGPHGPKDGALSISARAVPSIFLLDLPLPAPVHPSRSPPDQPPSLQILSRSPPDPLPMLIPIPFPPPQTNHKLLPSPPRQVLTNQTPSSRRPPSHNARLEAAPKPPEPHRSTLRNALTPTPV